jgi:hypothetical protein
VAFHASSYIKTTTVAVQRVRDQLSFPFTAKPQAMTVYVRFLVEYPGMPATDRALVQIGSNGTSNPRWYLAVSGDGTNGLLKSIYHNGITSVTNGISPLTLTPGVLWEVRGTLTATGVLQQHYSIAGVAEVSGSVSSALALPSAWASQHITLNSAGNAGVNWQAYTHVWVGRGVQTRETCRRMAGV